LILNYIFYSKLTRTPMASLSFKTLVYCGIYMMIGPALILLNKYILSSLDFPYPMFLSGLGVACSGVFAHILVRLYRNISSYEINVKVLLFC
jgi:hypothetical protein